MSSIFFTAGGTTVAVIRAAGDRRLPPSVAGGHDRAVARRPARRRPTHRPARTRVAHVAIWTQDTDRLAAFYVAYLGARAGDR